MEPPGGVRPPASRRQQRCRKRTPQALLTMSSSGPPSLDLALENIKLSPPSPSATISDPSSIAMSMVPVCNSADDPFPPPLPLPPASTTTSHQLRGVIATVPINANGPSECISLDSHVARSSKHAALGSLSLSVPSVATADAVAPRPVPPAMSSLSVTTILPKPPASCVSARRPNLKTSSVLSAMGSKSSNDRQSDDGQLQSSEQQQQQQPSRKEQRAAQRAGQRAIAGREFRLDVLESVGSDLMRSARNSAKWTQLDDSDREIADQHMWLVYDMISNLLSSGLQIRYPAKEVVLWWFDLAISCSPVCSLQTTWPGLMCQMSIASPEGMGGFGGFYQTFQADFFECSDGHYITAGDDPGSLQRFEESLRDGYCAACDSALHLEDDTFPGLGDTSDGAEWDPESASD